MAACCFSVQLPISCRPCRDVNADGLQKYVICSFCGRSHRLPTRIPISL